MGFIPVQPQKTREMRERYRKSRRKQQVQFTLLGCAALLVVGLIAGVWWLFHRGAGTPGTGRLQAARPVAGNLAKPLAVVGEKQFDSAPWVFEVDAGGFYYFSDLHHNPETRPNYPCDTMGAVPAKGGKPRWVQQGDFPLQHTGVEQGLDSADGTLLGLTARLTDKRLEITAWNSADGVQRWRASVDSATDGVLRGQGNYAILSCLLKDGKDGHHMLAYDTQKGTKVWDLKLPLRGLHKEKGVADPPLERHDTAYGPVYTCGNVIGSVDPTSGKLRRDEFAATGAILDMQIEEHSQTAYILVQGNQQASVSIVAVPLSKGAAHSVLNLQSADGKVFFVASPDWLLTCCREPVAATAASKAAGKRAVDSATDPSAAQPESALRVRCQPLGPAGAQFSHEIEGAHAMCGAVVPGQSPAFLLGLALEGKDGNAQGTAQRFVLVDPVAGEVTDAGKTDSGVLSILPFKANLLGIGDGGTLYRFDGRRAQFVRLRKLRYPQLFARLSDDRTTLLVGSSTEQYFSETYGTGDLLAGGNGKTKPPGAAPLQVLVLQ